MNTRKTLHHDVRMGGKSGKTGDSTDVFCNKHSVATSHDRKIVYSVRVCERCGARSVLLVVSLRRWRIQASSSISCCF